MQRLLARASWPPAPGRRRPGAGAATADTIGAKRAVESARGKSTVDISSGRRVSDPKTASSTSTSTLPSARRANARDMRGSSVCAVRRRPPSAHPPDRDVGEGKSPMGAEATRPARIRGRTPHGAARQARLLNPEENNQRQHEIRRGAVQVRQRCGGQAPSRAEKSRKAFACASIRNTPKAMRARFLISHLGAPRPRSCVACTPSCP
jgi:hypothetical protein